MSLEGVTTRFLQILAVSTVLSTPALAAPVLLGAIEHDYGSAAGRVGTTSGSTASYGCDGLQARPLSCRGITTAAASDSRICSIFRVSTSTASTTSC